MNGEQFLVLYCINHTMTLFHYFCAIPLRPVFIHTVLTSAYSWRSLEHHSILPLNHASSPFVPSRSQTLL